MTANNVQNVCGILGLVVILLGATLGMRGVPAIDWIAIAIGAFLLTYAMFTGDRVLLFDRVRYRR